MTRTAESLIVGLLLTLLAAALLVDALTLGPAARAVPVAIAIPTLAMLVWHLVTAGRRAGGSTAPRHSGTAGRDVAVLSHAEAATLAWMALLVGSLWVFGILAGLPSYVLVYLRVRSRERWPIALVIAGGVWVVLFVGLVVLLRVRLHNGIVWSWLAR